MTVLRQTCSTMARAARPVEPGGTPAAPMTTGCPRSYAIRGLGLSFPRLSVSSTDAAAVATSRP